MNFLEGGSKGSGDLSASSEGYLESFLTPQDMFDPSQYLPGQYPGEAGDLSNFGFSVVESFGEEEGNRVSYETPVQISHMHQNHTIGHHTPLHHHHPHHPHNSHHHPLSEPQHQQQHPLPDSLEDPSPLTVVVPSHPATFDPQTISPSGKNSHPRRTGQSKDPVVKARVSAMRKERSPEGVPEGHKKLQATTSMMPALVTPDNHLFQFADHEKPLISRKRSNSLPSVITDGGGDFPPFFFFFSFPFFPKNGINSHYYAAPMIPVPGTMQPMIVTNAYDANGVLQPVYLPVQGQPYVRLSCCLCVIDNAG